MVHCLLSWIFAFQHC